MAKPVKSLFSFIAGIAFLLLFGIWIGDEGWNVLFIILFFIGSGLLVYWLIAQIVSCFPDPNDMGPHTSTSLKRGSNTAKPVKGLLLCIVFIAFLCLLGSWIGVMGTIAFLCLCFLFREKVSSLPNDSNEKEQENE